MASTLGMRTALSPRQWQPWTAVSSLLGVISVAFPARSHLRSATMPLLPRRAQKLHSTNKVGIKLPFDQRVKIYAIREY